MVYPSRCRNDLQPGTFDGVTIDLTGLDGGNLFMAGITTLPAAGNYLV